MQAFLAEGNRTRLDPEQIEGEVYNRYMDAFRPFFKSMLPFVGETIALEPFIDIWRDDDDNYTMSVGSDILRGQKPAS